ncbi:MAG: flagellar biosynthesis anti-sigma factor FlgM [Planctomycetia bacterium]|nr:flagellar biosynthesis anti-sigma factor FlgM [Planctomycetia bacterium]
MQIYGANGVHGVQSLSAPHSRKIDAPQTTSSAQPQDEVQISSAASFIDQVHQVPDIRQDRVAAIKAAIADGTYETSGKLDAALNAFLDEIA